jgi:hypothetical protein
MWIRSNDGGNFAQIVSVKTPHSQLAAANHLATINKLPGGPYFRLATTRSLTCSRDNGDLELPIANRG